jgi:hypothetical protein
LIKFYAKIMGGSISIDTTVIVIYDIEGFAFETQATFLLSKSTGFARAIELVFRSVLKV